MLLEIILAILIGCLFGILTGLIPGVHINLVAATVLGLSALLLNIAPPITIAVFIVAMSITHTFLDSIPSIFLGAPDAEIALSVLPGHRLLLGGKGYEAVMLTLIGSLFSIIGAIILAYPIKLILEAVYPLLKASIGYILIFVSIFLILREKKSKQWASIIFILSGVLGLVVLNLPNLSEPLFPLFSGLFGVSILLNSLNQKTKIPKQKIENPLIEKNQIIKGISGSLIVGIPFSFLAGLGPAQAAILGSQLFKDLSERGFLILVGGLNTVNMLISFLALFVIDKARNGAVVAISKIIKDISLEYLLLFFATALIAAGIATFLTIYISRGFSKLITKINYKKVCIGVIVLISALVLLLTNIIGFLVLVVSTALGLIPALRGVGKNHLMGSLILPVIFYFLF